MPVVAPLCPLSVCLCQGAEVHFTVPLVLTAGLFLYLTPLPPSRGELDLVLSQVRREEQRPACKVSMRLSLKELPTGEQPALIASVDSPLIGLWWWWWWGD